MQVNYKQIKVICPMCGKEKNINIPETIFSQKKMGTIKVQVPTNAVCPDHQFIIFVDIEGNVRKYEKIDLQMNLPKEDSEKEKRGILTLKKLIQLYGLYGVFCLIHAKIFGYPTYIVIGDPSEDKADLMNLIGDRLMPEQYRGGSKLKYILETDYNRGKLKDQDALVINSHQNIIRTPWEEKLKFEEEIIKEAVDIIDEEDQQSILKQNITKFINEAEYTKNLLENIREIYEDDLIDKISQKLMIPKITHYRLLLIKNFIKNRFSPKLANKIKNKVDEFLGV